MGAQELLWDRGNGGREGLFSMTSMDYDSLTYDFQQVPALKLLKAEHAVLILSFLYQQFKHKQRVNVPLGELSERLDDYLETLNMQQDGRYPRTALAYLTEWSDDEHRFIRIVNNEEPVVELTADTERAIGWLEELHAQPFVGTESRFLSIIQMLRDMVYRSTEDPELRLQQLEQQRDELQRQIDMIYQTGEVEDRYTPTQIKERFFEVYFQARQLLRDFRLIEEKFRAIARSIREAQLSPDAQKGSLIEYVLDADHELKASDQGRSFYAFWEFLIAPSRRAELSTLLKSVRHLVEGQSVLSEEKFLQRLPTYLVDAASQVVRSNSLLAEQLRRILDEKQRAEHHRIHDLIWQIKQHTLRTLERDEDERDFCELEGLPLVQMPLERPFWEPALTTTFQQMPEQTSAVDLFDIDLSPLHNHFYVDERELRLHIEKLLTQHEQIELSDVLALYPLKKGLTELLTYYTIAAGDLRHCIDPTQQRTITLTTVEDRSEKRLTIPRVLYCKDLRKEKETP
jgi:hypothetical protein